MSSSPIPTEGGPYRAEFGAVVHDDFGGALFTVSPPHLAYLVADALNANARTLPTLLDVARLAAVRFREYEALHAAKPDPEKARRNAEIAEQIEAALAQATGGEDGR